MVLGTTALACITAMALVISKCGILISIVRGFQIALPRTVLQVVPHTPVNTGFLLTTLSVLLITPTIPVPMRSPISATHVLPPVGAHLAQTPEAMRLLLPLVLKRWSGVAKSIMSINSVATTASAILEARHISSP